MKLVISEKPSVAQSIAAVIGAKQRGEGIWRAAAILFHGASAISRSWQAPAPMVKNTRNGGVKIYLSCREIGGSP